MSALEGLSWREHERFDLRQSGSLEFSVANGNLQAFAGLDALRGRRLRLTLEITGEEVRAVAGGREWRDTISARIVEMCIVETG